MKKHIIPLIFCLLLLYPINLESSQFNIKIGLGLFQGGKIQDVWRTKTDFYDYTSIPGEKTELGLDISLELLFQINSSFGFSLGTGYISKAFSGSVGQFKVPDTGDLSGDFSYSPMFNSDMYPFYFTAIWSHPVRLNARLNFLGGVGYYFGKIKCLSDNFSSNLHDLDMQWSYFSWIYESNINTIGFHLGTGLEIDLSNKSFLFVEALYRGVKFKKFKTSHIYSSSSLLVQIIGEGRKELGGESTFMYAQRLSGDETWGDIDYRFYNLNFSGLFFRVGVKFRL